MTWKEAIKRVLLNPIVAALYGYFLPVMVLGAIIHKSEESPACAIIMTIIIAAILIMIVYNKTKYSLKEEKED